MVENRGRGGRPDEDGDWFTISYRTIYLAVLMVALGVALFAYLRYVRVPPAPPSVDTTAAATTARFTSLVGTVKVKAVGTFEWVSANRDTPLRKADLVRTSPGSTAEITFFDGTVVHVRPDSLITIEETSEDPTTKRRRVAWHVSSGEVNLQTARQAVPGSATLVSTPTVKSTVGELSSANIRVAEAGDSYFRLFRGEGRVETKAGSSVEMKSNEALQVDSGGKAAPKVRLLDAPEIVAPTDGEVLTPSEPGKARARLAWKASPGARSYRLLLDVDSTFSRPLVDRRGVTQTTQDLRGLEEGRYFWRVSAVDARGNESAFSGFGRFSIARAAAALQARGPVLEVDVIDVRTNTAQIKGRTEPGTTLTINGQRVDVFADGSFNAFIVLERMGRQTMVLRAVGINGGVAELRRSIEATF